MIKLKERFFLPSLLYNWLKKIYYDYVKQFHEKWTFGRLTGEKILFVQCNIGEVFFFANALKDLNEYDFIYFNKEYQKQIFDLYFSGYKNKIIKSRVLASPLKCSYQLKNKQITVILGKNFWEHLFAGEEHFVASLSQFINKDFMHVVFSMPRSIDQGVENTILRKIADTGLNINNFVVFSTEASSMSALPPSFVSKLIDYYKRRGIDVYINANKSGSDCDKSFDLTISELLQLSIYAKEIITLRSGLTEVLCLTKKPIHVIYTNNFEIKNFYQNYSLKGYNFDNSIFEYTYDKFENCNALIEAIDHNRKLSILIGGTHE